MAHRLAELLQGLSLLAVHVGAVAGQEHHPGALPLHPSVGQLGEVGPGGELNRGLVSDPRGLGSSSSS